MRRWLKQRLLLIHSIIFYAIVGYLACLPTIQQRAVATSVDNYAHTLAAEPASITPPKQPISDTPVQITIPRIAKVLPVIKSSYNTQSNSWPVEHNVAHYADVTSPITTGDGFTLIYGHRTADVFLNIDQLHDGDNIYIKTAQGHIFTYTYKSYHLVRPTDTSIFHTPVSSPTLAIMSCEGTWNEWRREAIFTLQKES